MDRISACHVHGDQASQPPTTAQHDVTIKQKGFCLPRDVLFEIISTYLMPSDTVQLMLTCRRSLKVVNSDRLWEMIYKTQQQKYQYLDDRFSRLIKNVMPNREEQDRAYKQLCGLIAQGKAPWKAKAIASPSLPWSLLKSLCSHVTILSNGNIAMSGFPAGIASMWTPSGQFVATLQTPHNHNLALMAPLANGRLVTADFLEPTVHLWSDTGQLLKTFTNHDAAITCMEVLPNGNIVTGSKDNLVIVQSPVFENMVILIGHTRRVTCIAVLSNSKLVTGSEDGSARVWSIDEEALSEGICIATLRGHTRPITCIAVLPNGNIVTGSEDGTAIIWSPKGVRLATTLKYQFGVACMTVLANGNFVTTSFDQADIWSPGGNHIITVEHVHSIESIASLPHGGFVTGSSDDIVRIWSPAGVHVATLVGHKGPISSMKVFPNGDILTGSWDSTARIWTVDIESLMPVSPCNRASCWDFIKIFTSVLVNK